MPTTSTSVPAPSERWARLYRYDRQALLRVGELRAPWATRLMRALTRGGDPSSWVAVGLVVASAGRRGRHAARLMLTAATMAALVAQVLKRSLPRPRPSSALEGFVVLTDDPDAFSFPSGHAAGGFAVAAALGGNRGWLDAALALYALGIASSRVYLGAHYPLDVLAGSMVGAASGLLTRSLIGGPRRRS